MALTDKNLYAYCDNNPIMRRDDSGEFWDTFFDVLSLTRYPKKFYDQKFLAT